MARAVACIPLRIFKSYSKFDKCRGGTRAVHSEKASPHDVLNVNAQKPPVYCLQYRQLLLWKMEV